jgi:hypothetical protein
MKRFIMHVPYAHDLCTSYATENTDYLTRVIPKLFKNTKNLKENLGFRIMIILISLINNKAYKYFYFLFFLTNYKDAFGIYNKF